MANLMSGGNPEYFPELQQSDPLGEALHFLHMHSVFTTRSYFSAPWGLALPAMPGCLMFHVVTAGECLLEVQGGKSCVLRPGDFALVPHGEGHKLLHAQDSYATDLFDLTREQVSERYEILRHGLGGSTCDMVCGAVRFEHPAAGELLKMLPGLIHIESWKSPQSEWMQSTLRLMIHEAQELRPGGETIVTRLADILVIQAIRFCLSESPPAQSGWLAAIRDPQLGRAILLVQRAPEKNWTVESLALATAMSRSAFAAKFKELVGEPPMQFVARWRMNVALSWLREGNESLNEMSERLGYQSEAAFSRAFKRYIGVSPGAVRRERQEFA